MHGPGSSPKAKEAFCNIFRLVPPYPSGAAELGSIDTESLFGGVPSDPAPVAVALAFASASAFATFFFRIAAFSSSNLLLYFDALLAWKASSECEIIATRVSVMVRMGEWSRWGH
jgi:hypothetical protein